MAVSLSDRTVPVEAQALPWTRPVARWTAPRPVDVALAQRLGEELHLPPLIASLLVARGLAAVEDARNYLRPRMEQLHPPLAMRGMAEAVERLSTAIRSGETVLVHGDYDVDGMCSTTLLVKTLRHLGANAVPFAPHRINDGYDLGEAGVRAAVAAGAALLVTCDCGTTAHDPVADLRRRGIDVIITDHHLPSRPPPECVAVLNPRVPGCDYPDKDLCAAGVAFKLSLALLEQHGAGPNVALNMLDLVALATVADVAPLRGENRILVRYGLRLMAETKHIGLRALINASGLEGRELTAGRIGFILAPRLNAVGRIGDARRGLDLLLSTDEGEANAIARDLEEINRTRQAIDRETLEAARKLAATQDLDSVAGLVLAAEGWHAGVIGIVASRLVEDLYRPVVLVAVENGIGKGSGRSIPAFDLHGGLTACADLLMRYGGHRAAAGLTVDAARIPELASRFDAVARERLTGEDLTPELRVDLEVPLGEANDTLERLLRHFEPFGIGNPAPLLATRGIRLASAPRAIGQNGLKFALRDETTELEGVWWGVSHRASEWTATQVVDVAYRLERDLWRDTSRLVARLADIRG
ncbi:MAG TPA: single-stranded-DNA-specific exonuclease RecJ [Gemmatimonadaceae bacterium]